MKQSCEICTISTNIGEWDSQKHTQTKKIPPSSKNTNPSNSNLKMGDNRHPLEGYRLGTVNGKAMQQYLIHYALSCSLLKDVVAI